jgi:predicted amidophosphoribosyltransferase
MPGLLEKGVLDFEQSNCRGCGAEQPYGRIRCDRCGKPLVFPVGYPPGWPRCPVCGEDAMDGHITCGRVTCDESAQRERAAARRDPLQTDLLQ